MPYKFKVGDRVKVLTVHGGVDEAYMFEGRVGTVIDIDYAPWPYEVKFSCGSTCLYDSRELERVPKKAKKKRGK